MGNDLIPYSIAVGAEKVYFFSPHCKVTKKVNIPHVDLLKRNGNSVDPFHYHVEKLCPD